MNESNLKSSAVKPKKSFHFHFSMYFQLRLPARQELAGCLWPVSKATVRAVHRVVTENGSVHDIALSNAHPEQRVLLRCQPEIIPRKKTLAPGHACYFLGPAYILCFCLAAPKQHKRRQSWSSDYFQAD